jgi:tRNA A-37 threonylcarbamoyl transferase component Bud32
LSGLPPGFRNGGRGHASTRGNAEHSVAATLDPDSTGVLESIVLGSTVHAAFARAPCTPPPSAAMTSPLAQLTPETWPAVSALLDEALALDPAERDTFVQQLDGERAQYRDTLRQLLAQATGVETGDFLATLPRIAAAGPVATDPLGEPASGAMVGPYRLLSELGAGGMGTVWLAERADGTLKRKVALKLPRLAWGRGLAERMARERDILASLEHPHIARLYDAGVDQHGRPYLALEYVEGQPIDVYAKERALSVRTSSICCCRSAAVAFAHSRLVVHRDLKPTNILVTADGQVRLLDFGIAKLMEGDRTQETQLTQVAGRALTLDYASPEQIKGEPIGTASDVYSLGVVAYELLTGCKAVQAQARQCGRTGRGDRDGRRAQGKRRGGPRGEPACATWRPRRDPQQGAEKGGYRPLRDGRRLFAGHHSAFGERTGQRATRKPHLRSAAVRRA